jgi:uncharacterized integral membrane protein
MRWVKTFLIIVALFVAIIFAIQNQSEVTLRFMFPWENHQWFEIPGGSLPVFLIIFCSIFLGLIIGGMGDVYKRFQLKRMLRQNQKTIEKLEKEIQSLRGPGLEQPSLLNKGI